MLKNKSVIDRMDLWEKAAMLSGKDTWRTMDFEKYGIPSVFLSDGPHGLRKQKGAGDHLGLNPSVPATCYPTAATMANSWDEHLCEELGEHLGKEAAALDVHVVLGPGLNMKRSPLCGRNFEYFSEDPYLAGKLAAAYIRGIQKNGTAACPKHFAANSQELRRMSNNSVVDEWGFDGFVVSDWGGSNDHALGVQNGSHLEMPSTGRAGAGELVKAVREGKLDEKVIDQRLDELLTVIFALHQAAEERKESDRKYDADKHHEFAKKAARESIVLSR